ncbi:hypothetical protein [Hyalangium rubrum]|uniref:Uncharacterized protein n=1 Tax=Hyalangium rubrum TaxID=3103134 RepID=A0ABU5GZM9_9BACT|nr:hypothetical protein [Hyalangium sp. s54d21]MDY7226605.1 hypothetical protein [Hyalangium sp. s54d21]
MTAEASAQSHHFIVKYMLARMALSDPERFVRTFTQDTAYLKDLWMGLGMQLHDAKRVPAEGLSLTRHGAALVVTFPPPRERNDCLYQAFYPPRAPDAPMKVFGLEVTAPLPGHASPPPSIAEWRRDARCNWGFSPGEGLEAFLQRVNELLADPQARPMTFMAIRLA